MFSTFINNPIEGVLLVLSLVIAITVHEAAHAWMADRLGDPTAKLMGRLTLNPLKHVDLWGTLFILIARFGWGRPVPVDSFNLKNPRRDNALISLSGPVSNLIVAVLCSLLILGLRAFSMASFSFITIPLASIVVLNVSLAIFNLIPIHPLDGFTIVEGFLPEKAAQEWHGLKSLGILMLFVLVFPIFGSSPILSLIYPIIDGIIRFLLPTVI